MNFLKSAVSKKGIVRRAVALLLLIAGISGCKIPIGITLGDGEKITGLSMNKASLSLVVGSSERLVATVAPPTAANKAISWSSSNANVCVTAYGVVTALIPGSATISATTMDGSCKAICEVTVSAPVVAVTGLALNKPGSSIGLGLAEQLEAIVSPADATNKMVTWSSDSANASVSSTGLVTAVALGTARVTATTDDGSFTASCVVTVIPVPVTGVSLNKTSTLLAAGQSETLTATVHPSNAENKALSWSSSDNDVAVVSAGQVMGLSAGAATITVTTDDGPFTASCIVTVTGSLLHTYAEVLPAATALQNGINAALASNDPTSPAYCEFVLTPAMVVTCHLRGYVNSGYTLTGSIAVNVNSDYTLGAMNGTVLFAGGIVTEI